MTLSRAADTGASGDMVSPAPKGQSLLSMFVPPALERSTGHMRLSVRLSERRLMSVNTDDRHDTRIRDTVKQRMVRHHNDRRILATPG